MPGASFEFQSPARPHLVSNHVLALRVVLLALLTCLSLLVTALHAADEKREKLGEKERAVVAADPAGHGAQATEETPSALEEVLDNPDGHWEIFKTFGVEFHLKPVFGFPLTKYMIIEVIAALLIAAIYIPLARRVRSGEPPQGWRDNIFEAFLTFIRDEVAKPSIGEHDADKYVPFLWTMFLFILFNNLLGMVPFGASPTASIYVTGALALCVFIAIHGAALSKMGFAHYVQSYWPHIDAPFGMGYVLKPLIFGLELLGVVVRNAVLAVRLFANMFAGHMVSGTILLFIAMAAKPDISFGLWSTVTLFSVLGVVALSLLELFVAFLQAYIFVFLTALFMGLALHPQH